MESQYIALSLIFVFIGLFFYVMYVGSILANRKGAHISPVPFMAGICFTTALFIYPKTRAYCFIGLFLDISFYANISVFPDILQAIFGSKVNENVYVSVLSDNTEYGEYCGEHGLSLYIEFGFNRILLDSGSSSLFYENAKKLGIDLSAVDFAVLSHSHYDHSNGFDKFFEINDKAKLYARAESGEYYYSRHDDKMVYIGPKNGLLDQHKDRIVYIDRDCNPTGSSNVVLIPHNKDYSDIVEKSHLYRKIDESYAPDDLSHEQTLILYSPKGLVIFNSCSHGGVNNIIKEVKEYDKNRNIYAYVGGFHLLSSSDEEILKLAHELKESEVQRIITGHCTGDKAFAILKSVLGDRIEKLHSGMRVEL